MRANEQMSDEPPKEQRDNTLQNLVKQTTATMENDFAAKKERQLDQREKWPLPTDFLDNPLSESARKARRTLLAVSALGIAIVWTGLFPEKIAFSGVEFAKVDISKLLWFLGAIIVFFLLEFLAYCIPDLQNFLLQLHEAEGRWMFVQMKRLWGDDWEDHMRGRESVMKDRDRLIIAWKKRKKMLSARAIIEYCVPVIIACVSIYCIVRYIYR